jgi:hypothetical protein
MNARHLLREEIEITLPMNISVQHDGAGGLFAVLESGKTADLRDVLDLITRAQAKEYALEQNDSANSGTEFINGRF